MRGCGVDGKMEEIGRMFESRNMDVLALSETKLKGKGEIMFGGVHSGAEHPKTCKKLFLGFFLCFPW